jgi:hypothetical protein
MEVNTLVLKDGKEYSFSDVPIGYFRRFAQQSLKETISAQKKLVLTSSLHR